MSILGDGNGQQTSSENTQPTADGSNTTSTSTQGSWRDTLPDELKNDTSLAQFTDVAGLAKSYLSTKSMVGKKGVFVPGEKATDEEWSSFFKSIGQPELDKFDISVKEEASVNKDLVAKFKEMAHKSGLLPKQAQALFDWYSSFEQESVGAMKAAQEQKVKDGLAALKKELGDGYDRHISLGELAVSEVGGEEFGQYLMESGLSKDPTIIKFLSKVGKLLGEDKIIGDGAGKFGQTPEEIQKEITDIMGNSKHPYFDRSHPSHQSEIRAMEDRYKKLSKATNKSA